jgi:hypothetical protein
MVIQKKIKFESDKDVNFKVVNVDGVFGQLNPNYGQMTFFVDIPEIETGDFIEGKGPEMSVNKVKRIFIGEMRMSPSTFKSIAEWMSNNVKNYEKIIQSGDKQPETQIYYQ